MNHMEECYRLLDVGVDASAEEIRQGYLILGNVWHPDRFTHDPALQGRAIEKLKAINGAFERIKDAPLRSSRPEPASPVAADRGAPSAPRADAPAGRTAAEWFQLGLRLSSTRV